MPTLANEETIRELRATIEAHLKDSSGDARALQALEALAAIRDDRSLAHIHAVATRAKGKLGKRAVQILGDVCRQRGLSPDELEDRIVPELGLDERGTMTFDYGSRQFTVGFDEQLEPFVRDDAGNRLAAIPRAAKDDDPEKAKEAAATWKQLKDDVKTIGKEQSQRLERAMCAERHWTAQALTTHLVNHRLLGHLARRLVFATLKISAGPTKVVSAEVGTTFRIAEDGTYEDQTEHSLVVTPETRVVIVHPVLLDEATRARWRQVFLDYRVVQPFAQIDREIVEIQPDELHTASTKRFEGTRVHAKSFWGLKHRGWELGYQLVKRLGPGVRSTLQVTPSLDWYSGKIQSDQEHTLGTLEVIGRTFAALKPIVRSELLRDVALL